MWPNNSFKALGSKKPPMRITLLLVSILGVLLFAGAFALSFANPLLIERAAREIVRVEVERKISGKLDALSDSRITALAHVALRKTSTDIEAAQKAIREELPRKIADVVADMLDTNCECRKRLVKHAQNAESNRISSLAFVQANLTTLVESAYSSVTSQLMREFRIFTASNAIAFALLAVVTFFRRKATLQLLLSAVVLLGAVSITGSLYLFNQDWLHTVVYGQYVGLAYALYLAAVALLLFDVIFNRARITTRLLNTAFQAVGSATSVVPC